MYACTELIDKLLEYLNGAVTYTELVRWAEAKLIQISESDEAIDNETLLLDILGYIGAGDTPDFPLTWEVLSGFLNRLGVWVHDDGSGPALTAAHA